MWDFSLPIGNKFVYCGMRNLVNILVLFVTMFTFGQTTEELSMINEINKIRKDPKSYIPVVDEYIKKQEKIIGLISKSNVKVTVKSTQYMSNGSNDDVKINNKTVSDVSVYNQRIFVAKQLIKELGMMIPLDTLIFNPTMYTVTKSHGEYLTSVGKLGHYGKNGDRPYVRFKNIGNVSENVATNHNNPLLRLMIDYGVSNIGHRKNILDPKVKYISIFINNHCVVQNFME